MSNPAPEVSIQFGGKHVSLDTEYTPDNHQYIISIELPKLTASDCGKTLKYNISVPHLPRTKPLIGMSRVVLKGIYVCLIFLCVYFVLSIILTYSTQRDLKGNVN